MVGALLAGCSASGGSTKGSTTLTIWDYSVEQTAFHKQVAAEFSKQHPGTKVEWRSITQDQYKQTLPLAFQSNQGPDIFYWSDNGPLAMSQLLNQKWIRPLTADGKVPAGFTSRWPAGSFTNGVNTLDGKTYGFPFSESQIWGPGYMYLNKAVFKDAGLSDDQPPTTWSQLKDVCSKIKAKTKAYCITSPSKGVDLQRIWYALASGMSTDLFFNFKEGKFSLDDPQAQQTFAFVEELKKDGYLAPGTNDKDFARQQFVAGQAGVYMDGTWVPSVLTSQGMTADKYSVAARPLPDTGATGALARQQDGSKYWLSSKSKNAATAWTFINWLTDPNGYFATNYLKGGFGTLAFADNAAKIQNPAIKQITKIATRPGYRVQVPLPVLKCPDLVKSTAYVKAIAYRPNWEYEAMTDALNGNKPLASEATQVVTKRQQILTSELAKEAAGGLKVSIDCYTFADWNYTADYPLSNYPH
jgi:ABC-type glycerol-3-phosphate transport system substrate-binding protein